MSGSPDSALATHARGSTAPTPGFRGATSVPATSRLTHDDPPLSRTTSLNAKPGRGGSHHGTQGCTHRMTHSTDKVSPSSRSSCRNETSGTAAGGVVNLSRQPVRPASLGETLAFGPARTIVATRNMARSMPAQKINRASCPGKPGAHDPKRVGTYVTYGSYWGCRCPDTREAWRLFNKRGREGRRQPGYVDAIGARRRLRALTCLGYSPDHISIGLGLHPRHIRHIRFGRFTTITVRTHRRIAAYYAEHAMRQPLPPGPSVNRVIQHAVKAGWAPPLAWDDIDDPAAKPQHLLESYDEQSVNEDVDLEILLSGHVKHPKGFETPAARWRWRNLLVRAIHILTDRGLSLDEIAVRLKISERQVVRLKKISDDQLCRASRFNKDVHVETTPSTTTDTPREEAPAA